MKTKLDADREMQSFVNGESSAEKLIMRFDNRLSLGALTHSSSDGYLIVNSCGYPNKKEAGGGGEC